MARWSGSILVPGFVSSARAPGFSELWLHQAGVTDMSKGIWVLKQHIGLWDLRLKGEGDRGRSEEGRQEGGRGKQAGEQSPKYKSLLGTWAPPLMPTDSELAFFPPVHFAFCLVPIPLTPCNHLSYLPVTHQHLGPPRQSRRGGAGKEVG